MIKSAGGSSFIEKRANQKTYEVLMAKNIAFYKLLEKLGIQYFKKNEGEESHYIFDCSPDDDKLGVLEQAT
eukprot:CAMPEP_0116873084 /NCGR_PEP_ID=MMETSP0463-20121206/4052_1 /TAXON_ID=181622 /ORGANISM="Strombidinopsis sp, Strain SopsisLIS2011" /LENGTH=70 /DNA_ID=CAMNT_0004514387 /DNA_START=1658 /DNA_END=1870 /DNA_ORIENTATION=+